MASGKQVVILAGPNGAGKTTFASEFLPKEADCPVFINSDLIAAGLSPFAPELSAIRAGRVMLTEIKAHVRAGRSFAFETTLSGLLFSRFIPTWRREGYRVKLFFVRLASADLAVSRVGMRVAQGGHGVPDHVIRRRFAVGSKNLERTYKPLVDAWALYDNSGRRPLLIEEHENS